MNARDVVRALGLEVTDETPTMLELMDPTNDRDWTKRMAYKHILVGIGPQVAGLSEYQKLYLRRAVWSRPER